MAVSHIHKLWSVHSTWGVVHDAAYPGGTLEKEVACRQHLFHLLEELGLVMKQAASASAPHCAACLLRLTQILADQHASLASQSVPPDFAEVLAEAVRQSVGFCMWCVCHQVQAINLRLATSGLFDVQVGAASGKHPSCSCPPHIDLQPPSHLTVLRPPAMQTTSVNPGTLHNNASMSVHCYWGHCTSYVQHSSESWFFPAGRAGSQRSSSSMESSLTALLHMCHRLRQVKCEAWLLPHAPCVWNTLFHAFQAFCNTCEQLSMASCAAVAQPEQGSHRDAHTVQSVAARVAMFNALGSGKADKSRCSVQHRTGKEGSEQQARLEEGEVSSRRGHQQRLLILLTRCVEMEQLLAHLLPGFLALNADEALQVNVSLHFLHVAAIPSNAWQCASNNSACYCSCLLVPAQAVPFY